MSDKLQNLKRFFEQPSAKAYLTFENKPTDTKILEKFAKMIGGEHQDGVIFLEVETDSEFIQLLRPKLDKKTREVLDSPQVVALKKEKDLIFTMKT